jgi:hypothetical protein
MIRQLDKIWNGVVTDEISNQAFSEYVHVRVKNVAGCDNLFDNFSAVI